MAPAPAIAAAKGTSFIWIPVTLPLWGFILLIVTLVAFGIIVFLIEYCILTPKKEVFEIYDTVNAIVEATKIVRERHDAARYLDWDKQYEYVVETAQLEEALRQRTEKLGLAVGPPIVIPNEEEFYERQKAGLVRPSQRQIIHARTSKPSKQKPQKPKMNESKDSVKKVKQISSANQNQHNTSDDIDNNQPPAVKRPRKGFERHDVEQLRKKPSGKPQQKQKDTDQNRGGPRSEYSGLAMDSQREIPSEPERVRTETPPATPNK